MNNIKINTIDTLAFYSKCINDEGNLDSYRHDLMVPLEEMWSYLNAPITAKTSGGYDVVMASEMLGIWTPRKSIKFIESKMDRLKNTHIFNDCHAVIKECIHRFTRIGYTIPLDKITLAILLGDSENDILMSNQGYSGFGGIPGYIILIVYPNDFNKTRLKSALSHEFNHNIRFTYDPFNHGNVSVEDYLVIEGLAEVFAEEIFGIENRGPWVQDLDEKEMRHIIKVMQDGRKIKGFEHISAYMYGDEIASRQGFHPVGLPKNAGYTIGYHIVKNYLTNTNQTIEEATLTPTEVIINKSNIFS